MKPIYRRYFPDIVNQQLAAALPGYTYTPLKLSRDERRKATLFSGSRLYSRIVPQGTLFIHFIPDMRQERFLAEVGWSSTGRFPVALSSHGPLKQPENELAEPEWLIDFGQLYHRKHHLGQLGWDVLRCSVAYDHPDFRRIFIEEDLAPVSEDQACDRVTRAVRACVADLQDVAVPYLDSWLRIRGGGT